MTCIAFEDGAEGATVEHCTIDGDWHNWPGAEDLCDLFPSTCWWSGHTTQDIDASREIWKFFAEHSMPEEDPD